jgi:hypothetical protein
MLVAGTIVQGLVSGAAALVGLASTPLVVAMFAWLDRGLPYGWTKLPTGGRQWIRREEMDFSRLSLDHDGRLRLMMPSGRLLTPDDSVAVLRDLLDGYSWETEEAAQLAALQLARGMEPLTRVVELLRPAIESEEGGLPLGRLPAAWRAALDLALSASGGAPGRLTALAEKAREAQQVAAIAESLDDPERLP